MKAKPITEITLNLGMRGYGKSDLTTVMVSRLPRVIAVDPMREIINRLLMGEKRHRWRYLGTGKVIDFDPEPGSIKRASAFYVNYPMDFGNPIESIDGASRLAVELENVTLVIDEADLKMTATVIGRGFATLLHVSRHYGVGVIVTARRASGLPVLLRSQATVINVFRTREPRDFQYLKERTGDEPPNLRNLDVGFYWRYRNYWSLIGPDGKPTGDKLK